MRTNSIPSPVADYLKSHGAVSLLEGGLEDLAALVRLFQDTAPSPDADPLSQENLTFLTAVLDAISVLDECLYEHYRALIDLFRAGVFRAPREKLLAYPSWNGLRVKAVRLGILPGDLYGQDRPRPHIAQSDVYLRVKEGKK